MNLIQVTSDPLQSQNLVLPDGSVISLQIAFKSMQSGWFINSLIWKSFTLNGLRITNNPNMLFQFQNQLNFGLACFSAANREPTLAQDFSSGASKLYLLTQAEVLQYEAFIKNG